MKYLLGIYVVEMILHELYTGVPVGRVELIGDVPTERTKLTSLLVKSNNEKTLQYFIFATIVQQTRYNYITVVKIKLTLEQKFSNKCGCFNTVLWALIMHKVEMSAFV